MGFFSWYLQQEGLIPKFLNSTGTPFYLQLTYALYKCI